MPQLTMQLPELTTELFLPIFVALIVATLIILVPIGIFLIRRGKEFHLKSLPTDLDAYASINWTAHLYAKIFGLSAIASIVIMVLLGVFAPVEWRILILIPFIIAFPLMWLGVIAQMLPLKCKRCGVPMKVYCEETMVYRSEAINVHYFCDQCKSTLKETNVL